MPRCLSSEILDMFASKSSARTSDAFHSKRRNRRNRNKLQSSLTRPLVLSNLCRTHCTHTVHTVHTVDTVQTLYTLPELVELPWLWPCRYRTRCCSTWCHGDLGPAQSLPGRMDLPSSFASHRLLLPSWLGSSAFLQKPSLLRWSAKMCEILWNESWGSDETWLNMMKHDETWWNMMKHAINPNEILWLPFQI